MIFGQTPSTKPYLDVHDLQHTISMLGQLNAGDHSIFKGHLDMNRVGAMGHSAGGAATEALSAIDPRVKAWIGLAGATVGAFGQTTSGPGSMLPKVPSMIMAATDDGVVHYKAMLRSYGRLKTPKRFVALGNSGHLVFSDICRLGDGKGGLVGVGRSAGLPIPANLAKLGSDGCNGLADSPKTYLPVQVVWPAIDQAVVAQFRFALGFDDSQAGLENLAKTFSVVSLNLSRH
jgi:predicted dienelactone hydrolase